ncbi:MAG: hypothetical protein LQ337_003743 [Flavoplaca oasis]|nr:MAG: hypothetical protein LQ337_003743 [Flavoplaca oasis]
MSAFRRCCRHPRASSPGLPPAVPVPSPTQDNDHDADALPLTPTETLVGSLNRGPDEGRPSSDTVVFRDSIQKSRPKFVSENEEHPPQTAPESSNPTRVSSLTVPRRRSHARSQPVPATTAEAALDQYVKLSPSRIALRKRLDSVKILDDPKSPPLPMLSPARVTSIPESALPPQWRLDYNKSSSSFRKPGLREFSTNEHERDTANERLQQDIPSKPRPASAEVPSNHVNTGATVKLENERLTSDQASASTNLMDCKIPVESRVTALGGLIMRASRHSDSTAASIHLYNMKISERVASSNSNILPLGECQPRRQDTSTTESNPSLPMGMSRYQRDRQSSSLQSPKPSSSFYPSSEEELASSRRSSMLLIQSLPERLRRLKVSATSGDLYITSAQHSQITVIPRSRFPTTYTDESKKHGSNNGAMHEDIPYPNTKNSDKQIALSPSLRRSSTEPRLNRFRRDAPASFDGSGEWHLAPPSRQPTGLLARQSTGLVGRRPTGTLSPDDSKFVWEKALREHAAEDSVDAKVRTGSISYEIGRDDFKRRLRSRQFTRTPSPLGEISEDPWSQQRGHGTEPGSGRVSPTQAVRDKKSPIRISPAGQVLHRRTEAISPSGSVRSVDSWTRYPSHTAVERNESANERDKIVARDFAVSSPPGRKMSKQKSRSMTFGKKVRHKITTFYTTRRSDLRRYHAGHRSSIAFGGRLEYPELEIPPRTFDPATLSRRRSEEVSLAKDGSQISPGESVAMSSTCSPEPYSPLGSRSGMESPSPAMSPVDWGRRYTDLVVRPRNTSTDEEIAPEEMASPKAEDVERDKAEQAEVDAMREAALKAAEDCYKRSMDIDRYPERV